MTSADLAPPRRLPSMSAQQPAIRITVDEAPRFVAPRSTVRHVAISDGCTCFAGIMRFFLWGMRNSLK
jgi:hypothetical protein